MFVGKKVSAIEKLVAKIIHDAETLQKLLREIPKYDADTEKLVSKDAAAKMEKERFAIRLRVLRKDAGMTQRELAEKIGWCVCVVTRYENAKAMPRKKSVERLASALNVSVDALDIRKAYTK